MTKPAVWRGGLGRNRLSKLADLDLYIIPSVSSSSPETSLPPAPARLRRLAAELHNLGPRRRPTAAALHCRGWR
jgi:hypothetical protein